LPAQSFLYANSEEFTSIGRKELHQFDERFVVLKRGDDLFNFLDVLESLCARV
jgi:hypothetical protein